MFDQFRCLKYVLKQNVLNISTLVIKLSKNVVELKIKNNQIE
jgi:hypothetical protein